jgi:pilus assembly protein FimV
MAQMRFSLRIRREHGRPLKEAKEVRGVFLETHHQTTSAWVDAETPATRPLHNCVIALHPTGISVSGVERDGERADFQEWWLIPEASGPARPADFAGTALPPAWAMSAAAPGAAETEESLEEAGGLIQWKDSLSVGVSAIDEDHKVLVDLINQLHQAVGGVEERPVVGSVINSLVDYTVYHFSREERVQAAAGYPGLPEHHRLHEDLKATALDYQRRYQADPASVDVNELHAFLRRWLVQHIMQEDKAFAPYAVGKPEIEETARAVSFADFALAGGDEEDIDLFAQVAEEGAAAAAAAAEAEAAIAAGQSDPAAREADALAALEALAGTFDNPPAQETPADSPPLAETADPADGESFLWDDALAIGVKPVDDDHHILVDLVDQMHKARRSDNPTETVGSVLNALVDYTVYHFAREEKVMEAAGYPGLAGHRRIHEDLRNTALALQQHYAADPKSVDMNEIYAFLKGWLTHHIMREDKAIEPFARGKPEAEAAAEGISFLGPEGEVEDVDLFAQVAEEDGAAASEQATAAGPGSPAP